MGSITLWAGAIIIPAAGFLANLILRLKIKFPLSAGSDWILLLMVFDGTVLLAHQEFKLFVSDLEFRENIVAIFVIFLFLSFLFWITSVLHIEPQLAEKNKAIDKANRFCRFLWFASAWIMVISVTTMHILAFLWKK